MMRRRSHRASVAPLLTAGALVASLTAAACRTHDTAREAAPPSVAASNPARATEPPRPPLAAEPPLGCATLRDVSLSDVVRVAGSTLFYADAGAGLTLVDVSDAAHPHVTAVVPFTGAVTALFVREGVAWVVSVDSEPSPARSGPRTHVRGIDVRDPHAPRVVGDETREGSARDAKLVGGFLYVLRAAGGHAVVDAFGIGDDAVAAFDSLDVRGTPAQLAASAAGLAVVTVAADHADVAWLDLSMDHPGSVHLRGTVSVPGGVATWEHGDGRIVDADEGQRVRLVTCATHACALSEGATLRIVDFAAESPARSVTALKVTDHDGLPLTRFADGVLYATETVASGDDATTLHVIHTDQRAPRFAAHLPLRGRLSALVPRDGSLVALGTVGSVESQVRLIVHDVDVRNPALPRTRASVTFGSDWTWSGALNEDGAVSFDPSSHLLAVPFTAWRQADRRYTTGAQIVDLAPHGARNTASLPAEGLVERAVFLDGRLVTVGPDGIASIDYASTHEPELRERMLELDGPR